MTSAGSAAQTANGLRARAPDPLGTPDAGSETVSDRRMPW
jgi:hypothetical protein